jgi:hypothetical protein
MVWINKHDPPPALPEGWAWHEEHRCPAEALWEEVEARAPSSATAQGQGQEQEQAVFERWEGQQLFVIMGAGTSVQVSEGGLTCVRVCGARSYEVLIHLRGWMIDSSFKVRSIDHSMLISANNTRGRHRLQDFTQLKVANGASYPFDKELLQVRALTDHKKTSRPTRANTKRK